MSNCCAECFKDIHIRNTIEKYGSIGNCDFCAAKNVHIYSVSTRPNPISDMLTSLVQSYCISNVEEARLLKEALRDEWDIFNVGIEAIQSLIVALCDIDVHSDILSKRVIIPQKSDLDYLNDYGVVKGNSWSAFSESIKFSNRFHNNMFNKDAFAMFLSMAVVVYPKGTNFFRARIAKDGRGIACEEMYSPPREKRCAGRVNPEGIGVLYLSLDNKTVLNESRVNAFDYVSVGKFEAKQDIRVVNLSEISKMSPFFNDNDNDIIVQFAVNRKVFQDMAYEIAKPLRRSDSMLEYLPTQYISEYIKSQRYDGVTFESTLREGGVNLALFDESKVECINVETVEITKIEFSTT